MVPAIQQQPAFAAAKKAGELEVHPVTMIFPSP